jgi:transposase
MTNLAEDLVPDVLWALVAPALRRPAPHHLGSGLLGHDRVHGPHLDSVAAAARPRARLRSPATCWRRLTEWANAGVFDRLYLGVLDRLGEQGQLDWSRAAVDTMSVRPSAG